MMQKAGPPRPTDPAVDPVKAPPDPPPPQPGAPFPPDACTKPAPVAPPYVDPPPDPPNSSGLFGIQMPDEFPFVGGVVADAEPTPPAIADQMLDVIVMLPPLLPLVDAAGSPAPPVPDETISPVVG